MAEAGRGPFGRVEQPCDRSNWPGSRDVAATPSVWTSCWRRRP